MTIIKAPNGGVKSNGKEGKKFWLRRVKKDKLTFSADKKTKERKCFVVVSVALKA